MKKNIYLVFLIFCSLLFFSGCNREENTFNRGVAHYERGEYDLALISMNKVIEINPESAIAYSVRGLIHNKKNELTKAIADKSMAIKLKPDFIYAYFNRGIFYHRTDQFDKALLDFDKVIELSPDNAMAHNAKGDVFFEMGDYHEALKSYTKALKLDYMQDMFYQGRGDTYYKLKDFDKALSDYSKAIALDTQIVQVYNNSAALLASCPLEKYRDGAKALEFAKKAVELSPIAIHIDTLAMAYAATGDFDNAVKSQQEAIKLETNPVLLSSYRTRLNMYINKQIWIDMEA